MPALKSYRLCYQLFVVFIILILFPRCTKNLAGTEVTNEEGVKLVGKVLDQKGAGIPNIIAKIDKLQVADTTDNGGNYSFTMSSNTLKGMGVDLDTIKDSVKIYNTGTVVSVLAISKWIDTLPQVYLIQRNIYGTLDTDSSDFKRIEAVLTIYNKDDSIIGTMKRNLWFNDGTKGFSGFIYFPTNSADLKYSVFINVYNKDSLLSGMSKTVHFNDLAGDIEIPGFNPNTCDLQIFVGKDTTLTIKDTIQLSIQRVGDSLSKITKYEWNFNNAGYTVSSNNIGTFVLPDTEGVVQCIGRATDEFGNVAFDIIQIKCLKDIPDINFKPIYPLGFNSEGTVTAFVYDMGKIISWKWKIGNNLSLKQTDSIKTSTVTFTVPEFAVTLPCTLTVTDDDNNQLTKTIVLSTGEWIKRNSTVPYNFNLIGWVANKDSIFLLVHDGSKSIFYQYDQNFVPKQIDYYEMDWIPHGFLASSVGKKYLLTTAIGKINFYKEQSDSFIFIDSLNKVLYSPRVTILDNGTLCVSEIASGRLYFYSNADSKWTEKSIELPSGSDKPIISSLVSIGNDCYLAVGAEKTQPFLYKYDGNTITSITIGSYRIFNYLSINRDGNSLYICGNYYRNGDSYDSVYTFIHRLNNNSVESVITDIGGLSSRQAVLGGPGEKQIIEVTVIDSSLYLGMYGYSQTIMHPATYSSLVFCLRGNKLEQIGNTIINSVGSARIFKKNAQLFMFTAEGNVYSLQ